MAYQSLQTGKEVDDKLGFQEATTDGDDKGLKIIGGQFSVGERDDPRESVRGSGDSLFVHNGFDDDVAFHCDIANTVGNVINNADDISEEISSETGSSVGFFGGNTAGKYILIGSNFPYFGGKVKYDSLATVEPQNIVSESLNTSTWEETRFMGTNSNAPYEREGWNIAKHLTEQIFFGLDTTNKFNSDWTLSTLTINGTPITKYWGRFRIVTNITGDPIVQQIKLHTNRIEDEGNGTTHRYGLARAKKLLQSGINLSVKNDLQDPANEVVRYTETYRADLTDNEFAQGALDSFGYLQNIGVGVDTSSDLELAVSWYVKGSGTGDALFRLETVQVTDGFVYDGTYGENIKETFESIETISVDSNLLRKTSIFKIPINTLVGNGGVVINFGRVGNDPQDDLPSNIIVTNVAISAMVWEE